MKRQIVIVQERRVRSRTDPCVSDITLFAERCDVADGRQRNGADNVVRERILTDLVHGLVPDAWFDDPCYGALWRRVGAWKAVVRDIMGGPGRFTPIGGARRTDFRCSFGDRHVSLEFKVGESIFTAPQILSLSAFKSFLATYPKWYYDHYLPRVVSQAGVRADIPDWETYARDVVCLTPRTGFFHELDRAPRATLCVDESIATFLKTHASRIDVIALENEMASVYAKTYVSCSKRDQTFCVETIRPQRWMYHHHDDRTIVLLSDEYELRLLLRWRNGAGVLNPAYQIALRKSDLNATLTEEMEFTDASRAVTKALTKAEKAEHGIFLTPKSIRDRLWSLLDVRPSTILEPSCGSGEFVLDALQRFPDARITAVELRADVLAALPESPRVERHCRDFLDMEPATYDLIVGNPPYVVTDRKDKRCMRGRGNLFCLFLYECLSRYLAPNGVLAFVLPTSFMNGTFYAPCRAYLRAHHTVLALERASGRWLDTTQPTMILVVQNRRPTETPFFFGPNLSFHAAELVEMTRDRPTLASLGFEVRTGSVVWNQHKDALSDEGTFLCYSHNIVDGAVVRQPTRGQKKPCIRWDKETIRGPVIVTTRGFGNTLNFQVAVCDLPEFVAENHVNVVRPTTPDAVARLPDVARSLASEATRRYFQYLCGNGAVSASELQVCPV